MGHTETGTVLGTSHYIAPEQARGEQIDAQTDIYSFGVVLYELLTGELPYPGDNFLTVAMKHVNDPSPSVLDRRPDTPLRLASLIERCMAKAAGRPAGLDGRGRRRARGLSRRARREGRRRGDDDHPEAGRGAGEAGAAARAAAQRSPALPLLARSSACCCLRPRPEGSISPSATTIPAPGAASGDAVTLSGVGAYRPGRRRRRARRAKRRLATDGNPATFWRTSTYRSQLSAFKSGVGLVLEASGTPKQIAVTTDTPGFTAEIEAGDSAQGPFETVGEGKAVEATATWDLDELRGDGTTSSGSPSSSAARTSTR